MDLQGLRSVFIKYREDIKGVGVFWTPSVSGTFGPESKTPDRLAVI